MSRIDIFDQSMYEEKPTSDDELILDSHSIMTDFQIEGNTYIPPSTSTNLFKTFVFTPSTNKQRSILLEPAVLD